MPRLDLRLWQQHNERSFDSRYHGSGERHCLAKMRRGAGPHDDRGTQNETRQEASALLRQNSSALTEPKRSPVRS
jgi:hypothetical protein